MFITCDMTCLVVSFDLVIDLLLVDFYLTLWDIIVSQVYSCLCLCFKQANRREIVEVKIAILVLFTQKQWNKDMSHTTWALRGKLFRYLNGYFVLMEQVLLFPQHFYTTLTLSAPKAILRFLQTILIQVELSHLKSALFAF